MHNIINKKQKNTFTHRPCSSRIVYITNGVNLFTEFQCMFILVASKTCTDTEYKPRFFVSVIYPLALELDI